MTCSNYICNYLQGKCSKQLAGSGNWEGTVLKRQKKEGTQLTTFPNIYSVFQTPSVGSIKYRGKHGSSNNHWCEKYARSTTWTCLSLDGIWWHISWHSQLSLPPSLEIRYLEWQQQTFDKLPIAGSLIETLTQHCQHRARVSFSEQNLLPVIRLQHPKIKA